MRKTFDIPFSNKPRHSIGDVAEDAFTALLSTRVCEPGAVASSITFQHKGKTYVLTIELKGQAE